MIMIYIWAAIFIVSLLVEFSTAALVSIWFSAGSLVSLILAAFLGTNLIWLQILVFFIVSIATIFVLRPLVFKNPKNNLKTNVDSLEGTVATCVDPIKKYNPGTVKVNGLVWTAEVESEEEINTADLVKIEKVEGNKLLVKKYKENN